MPKGGVKLSNDLAVNRFEVYDRTFNRERAKGRDDIDIDKDKDIWVEISRECHKLEKPNKEFTVPNSRRPNHNKIRCWIYKGTDGEDNTPYATAAMGTLRRRPVVENILDKEVGGIPLRQIEELLGQYKEYVEVETGISAHIVLPRPRLHQVGTTRKLPPWVKILEKHSGPWYNLLNALDTLNNGDSREGKKIISHLRERCGLILKDEFEEIYKDAIEETRNFGHCAKHSVHVNFLLEFLGANLEPEWVRCKPIEAAAAIKGLIHGPYQLVDRATNDIGNIQGDAVRTTMDPDYFPMYVEFMVDIMMNGQK